MRLKSLEIKGFKSFADKTVLNFDTGITGVIGPNGCGKSNIIDSIRWVIGEQKISHLRSENLESLVFNGSKTRSASGLAEVSLTFENTKNLLPTEFNTVTVTRKFYKSGESEYRLNDVQCRLKDIQNLFMDTGVSTDSYAIIELGMVDEIIKDKENSRRRMLEQAAGITIYKTRKKEAKQKLDATEQDLARIEDLLFEINNQLKMLENQAKKAEKFYEIKKEYREYSIELAKASLEGFNLTYRDLNTQSETETDKKIRLEAIIANEEAGIEAEKVGFIEKERALQSMQHEFNDLLQLLRTKENDKNLASQKLNFLKERENSLQEFLNKSEGTLKGLEESIEFTKLQIGEEEGKLEGLEQQLEDLKASSEEKRGIFDTKRVHVDSLRSENLAMQRNQFEAEKKVAVADTSIQNLQSSISQIEEEKEVRRSQLKQLEEEMMTREQELESRKRDLQQLQEQHERTKEQILQSQSEMEILRQQLAEENRKLDAKRNEYDLLKSLIDSMEGYPESVKFLHNNPNWNHTAPILSDIIYVKEEFRAAVENVLEPYLNYYVVNNLQEGMQAVHLLDNNKKGKANFFLLDKLTNADASAHSAPADTIPAMQVIEVDEQYRQLAEHLLGNVFIAENESALENSNGSVVLEKTGKYVKGKFSLTGGSVGVFEGKKIGRAKNLEKLFEEIQVQEKIVADLKMAIQAKHNEVIGYNEQLKETAIKQAQEDINRLTNQVFSLQNKIESLHGLQSSSQNRMEDLQMNLQNTSASIEGTRQEWMKLVDTLNEIRETLRVAEEEYKYAESQYQQATASYNEFNLQVTRQHSRINQLKQESEFKGNQLRDLKTQIESNNAQLKMTVESLTENEEVLANAENGLVDMMRRKEEEEKKLNEADQAFYNMRNALNEKESELRAKVKEREQLDHLLTEIKDKLTELKLQLAGMKERLNVEFRIDLDEIIDQPRTNDIPTEELQEKCDRMKKRLENLGEVNPTAIEAFMEMKKRYEFILEQKNDLVTAKDSLMQTIQEVEATANQQFLDTFNQVRENFQKVFKALFTEDDTADMILENPENLAETGIDIVAKPKGKRPSSITQLSGGEKTLTATALLFAIYLIKPAPFCILDEVDAPLDDANVGKFTQMIRKFSEESQFIIVTHNKMTMSAVDVIYGVTMQEPGVSKLVPVDFRGLN
ncbi:chromosome segregation protein SMC [Pseudobacter ginsenosidimutans]|uniref:Chromosome partition protein Smc n=1 Tax=Pseudobacter ginsenosidimutans TaxID=661488 RepID=A0A4Q7MYP7_9BACT|nr:chromosome segregation protein SMC [Pseudobacter ginsenosidimutans]QEC43017.1 chromosome segregation protein SMC [Pseudobacter ginsenosidimutans]RZS74367.1 condensin subunit Smc [Pseudobacter ginsenosidimutans]